MHPIKKYIECDLHSNTNELAKKIKFNQGTINNWYIRHKKIDSINILFFRKVANQYGKTIDDIYNCLKKYENDEKKQKLDMGENTKMKKINLKKFVDNKGISLEDLSQKTGIKLDLLKNMYDTNQFNGDDVGVNALTNLMITLEIININDLIPAIN